MKNKQTKKRNGNLKTNKEMTNRDKRSKILQSPKVAERDRGRHEQADDDIEEAEEERGNEDQPS